MNSYENIELSKVDAKPGMETYRSLKIHIDKDRETKWLHINEDQYKMIRAILCGKMTDATNTGAYGVVECHDCGSPIFRKDACYVMGAEGYMCPECITRYKK